MKTIKFSPFLILSVFLIFQYRASYMQPLESMYCLKEATSASTYWGGDPSGGASCLRQILDKKNNQEVNAQVRVSQQLYKNRSTKKGYSHIVLHNNKTTFGYNGASAEAGNNLLERKYVSYLCKTDKRGPPAFLQSHRHRSEFKNLESRK